MNTTSFPSRLLENAVNEFAKLPGIGRKSALRLVLHLLKQEKHAVFGFADAIKQLRDEIKYCQTCHNISDTDVCNICGNPGRNHQLICVVESVRDVMAVENTQQFNGVYHVLGGVISPMDGVGPADLNIAQLEQRLAQTEGTEVVLALPTTMEGDTTNFYLYKRLEKMPVKVTTIARGVSIGDELEYIDEITLGRSLVNRQPFETTL